MKLIKVKKTYKTKDGIERSRYSFYLVIEGITKKIEVSPVSYGSYGNNYKELSMVAEYVQNNK